MQVFEAMIVLGDYVMVGITTWFLCMCARDNASKIGFSLMIVLFLSSAILISRR